MTVRLEKSEQKLRIEEREKLPTTERTQRVGAEFAPKEERSTGATEWGPKVKKRGGQIELNAASPDEQKKAAVADALKRIQDPTLALPADFRQALQDRLARWTTNAKVRKLVAALPPELVRFGLSELPMFLNQVAKWHDFKARHPMTAARDEAERDPWKNPARIADNARKDALAMIDNIPYMSPKTKLPTQGR